MQNTLHEHIMRLELNIQTLKDQLTGSQLTAPERDQIQSEVRIAELALAYYRKAYALEQTVTNPSPSDVGSRTGAAHHVHGRKTRRPPRTNLPEKVALCAPSHASPLGFVNRIEQSKKQRERHA